MENTNIEKLNNSINSKSVKYVDLLWVCLIFCIFFGATNSVLTLVSIVASFIFAIILGDYYAKNPSPKACIGIIYLLVCQNLCIGLGAHFTGNTAENLKFLTQIPFMCVCLFWVMSLFRKKFVLNFSNVSFILLLGVICVSYFKGDGEFQAKLVNIRNLTVFFMVFCIGKDNVKNKEQLDFLVNKFLKIARIVLYLGVILLIGGYPLYKAIGIHEVYIAKAAPFAEGALDSRFTTSLISHEFVRMGSIYYEPVNLAYFYAIAFILSMFAKYTSDRKLFIVNFIFMGLGLLLSFGKGGYLIVGALILALILHYLYSKLFGCLKVNDNGVTIIFTAVTMLAIVVGFCIFYVREIGAAVLPHFWGIEKTWQNIKANPFGFGLGTGGNAADSLGDGLGDEWLSSGGETALMGFMYQLGILGVAIFAISVLSLSAKCEKSNTLSVCMVYIPLILLGVSLMQDNTFTPQCIAPFMLFQGAFHSIQYNKVSNK